MIVKNTVRVLLTGITLLVTGITPVSQASASSDRLLLKNYREIFLAYASATGVAPQDVEAREAYRINIDRLPKTGVTDELSSPVILAATELSGVFCSKAISREQKQTPGERQLFPQIDFQTGPSQFSDYLIDILAQDLALNFWQRNAKPEEIISVLELIKESSVGAMTTSDTENILQILCTTYATSLAMLVK